MIPLFLYTHTHTLVASDGDELLSAGGEAVDMRSLYPGFSLSVVFKGAVHACGQLRNIPRLEKQLEKQKKRTTLMRENLEFLVIKKHY